MSGFFWEWKSEEDFCTGAWRAGDLGLAADFLEADPHIREAVAVGRCRGIEAAAIVLDGDRKDSGIDRNTQRDLCGMAVADGVVECLARGEVKGVTDFGAEMDRGNAVLDFGAEPDVGTLEKLSSEAQKVVGEMVERVALGIQRPDDFIEAANVFDRGLSDALGDIGGAADRVT